jgi:hypothetical protein
MVALIGKITDQQSAGSGFVLNNQDGGVFTISLHGVPCFTETGVESA